MTDEELLRELDNRLPDIADELELLLASHHIYLDHEPERGKRVWVSKDAYLPVGEKNWLLILRGGDEYGNRTVGLRISPKRYVYLNLNWPLKHELLDD